MNLAPITHHHRPSRIDNLHSQLLRLAQGWAARKPYDTSLAAEVRREALLLNHRHYLASVPAYRTFAEEAGVGSAIRDLEPIKRELLSTDDVFKSYDPTWLDERRYDSMNGWLGKIFHERISFDTAGIRTIDDWIERLMGHGVRVIYSSGSSGRFSFVPRDAATWHRFSVAPSAYMTSIALELNGASAMQRTLYGGAARLLDPFTFANVLHRKAMPEHTGVFLAFRGGHMGTQIVAQELAKRMGSSTFLYESHLSASTLRLLATGPKSPEDDRTIADFRAATVGQKDARFAHVVSTLEQASREGRKVFLAGAPYLFKELVEAARSRGTIALPKGSIAMTGGGWKTFSGEKIEQHALHEMVAEAFGMPVTSVVDAYSMAEIHGVVPRCEHGRYHVPPMIEAMVVDEEMRQLSGKDVTGTFAFLDPFALSYPGFIVTGDRVRMVDDETCACGVHGPAFLEIGRASGREVKGCGGVMASIQA
jgi:hypothetical protein